MSDECKRAAKNAQEAGVSLVSSEETHAARQLSACGFWASVWMIGT